ncbi:MAG: hypothetical protein A2148_01665 [Chloroflexi bacterium RBG_16_68_14]|nr:MAG: hypothetical protein A2148_01665 [Chloroflexi bacterium RBG_16_68_14]
MRSLAVQKLGIIAGLAAAVALVGGLALSSGASAQTPTVRVGSLTIGLGQEGTVEMEALDIGAPGLGAWTIDVVYDPAVARVVDCTAQHGGICNAAYAENTVRVTGVDIFGLEGDITFASITFACESVGTTSLVPTLRVFADATLGYPQDIRASTATEDGSVTCTEEPQPTPTPAGLPGDANCDGNVNSIDAALVLQLEADLIDALPCSQNADMNGDGAVNSIDAALILQREAGLLG